MTYIIGSYQGNTETVDEFETRQEALAMMKEYRLAFGPSWLLRLSRKPVND